MGEVIRTVLLQIASDTSVVELFDPLDGAGESTSDRDDKVGEGELAILGVAFRGSGEGVHVPDEMGLQEFDTFFEVLGFLFCGLLPG